MKNFLRVFALLLIAMLVQESALAQNTFFGKNRVQYDEFEWRFIQSEHFDIHYYDAKNYELAEFTAISLESSLRQLQDDFNHEIVDRIRVIIYDSHNDFSQTNVVALPIDAEGIGGVTDKLKNRITLPFDGDYNEFRRVIQHELVHAVFNDMFYGGTITSIIQNNIRLAFPLWFEEGLAEYMALGWDSNTDMFVRDAVLNNYLAPLPQLNGYFAYRGGQSFWNFIAEEYGREKIGEILNRIKVTRNVGLGLVQSTGLGIGELSSRWTDHLKRRYFPEVAKREQIKNLSTRISARGQQGGTYNTSPAISPQGDKVAMISNSANVFNVAVFSTITGRRLKVLTNGNSDTGFEELNILNPNLTWSPDGTKIALSAKSKGADDIAIIDYETGNVQRLEFPKLDAIRSVAWSPDGSKLAFDGNIGPFQDIFVYDFNTKEFMNVTGDFFSDYEPTWDSDSETIYFTSSRGNKVQLNTYKHDFNLLSTNDVYGKDIYKVKIGDSRAVQLTDTPGWDEFRPQVTRTGRMVFISDKNGIQNIYEFDLNTRTVTPLTNLQSGVFQISISADGSRLAVNAINGGFIDVFLIKSPFSRRKQEEPSLNYWAERRAAETEEERVPAIGYVKEMYLEGLDVRANEEKAKAAEPVAANTEEEQEEEVIDNSTVDFRNYVFAEEVIEDTTLELENLDLFEPEANITEDGRYQPRKYRLNFETDITSASGGFGVGFGTFATVQLIFSDLLGDHQLSFASNLQLDLRSSSYAIQYGYLKNRTNYLVNFSHFGQSFQTFSGDLFRFRNYSGGLTVQYPFNKFSRVDFGANVIGLVLDVNNVAGIFDNTPGPDGPAPNPDFESREVEAFFFPSVTFTTDRTRPGFITPSGGTRYQFGVSGSPGLGTSSPVFGSIFGDIRHYFNLGSGYTFAVRGSGGVSIGPDEQTFFLGGVQGWINQRFSNNNIPFDRLADNFFTQPALPLRGYEFNTINGSQYGLFNAEFRFPLFAALLPGPVPILPLYNLTGAAFVDAGFAWGRDINFGLLDANGNLAVNDADFDFKVGQRQEGVFRDAAGNEFTEDFYTGDILIGAGFGLRTIFLGLPFRWDVGYPYDRNRGFRGGRPIHYISIGVDF